MDRGPWGVGAVSRREGGVTGLAGNGPSGLGTARQRPRVGPCWALETSMTAWSEWTGQEVAGVHCEQRTPLAAVMSRSGGSSWVWV